MLPITIRDFKDVIEFTIANELKQPILGLGAAGIGKSEIIAQTAKQFGYHMEDLRLAQMSEVEIGGLIYPDESKTYTRWLKPDYFPEEGKQKTILLLDELTSAPKRIQVAAYQLVLDRRIGRHVLPDSTVIIALGNREEDNGVYSGLAAPLADRFEIYDIACNADIWLEDYAYSYVDSKTGQGVNSLVTGFIHEFPTKLHTQQEDPESIIFATPRSWKRVSDTLNASNGYLSETIRHKIIACVGDEVGSQFVQYCEKYRSFDTADKVLRGEHAEVPTDKGDILFMIDVFTGKLNELYKNTGDVTECAKIYNTVSRYASDFPPEYTTMCMSRMSKVSTDITAAAISMEDHSVIGKSVNKIADTIDDSPVEQENDVLPAVFF